MSISDPEGDLRLRVSEIEAKRVSAGEAYRSIHLGLGLVLFRIEQPKAAIAVILTLAATAAGVAITQSWIVGVAGLVPIAVIAIWIEASIENWVAEHNARVDDQVRELLHQTSEAEIKDGESWPIGS